MKNIFFLCGLGSLLVLSSCGPKKPEARIAPAGYQIVDLNPYGFSASILVPDSTKINSPLIITQLAGVEIKRGKNFDIVINTGDGEIADMVKQKSMISAEEPKKVKRWILDEPTAVIYEQQIADLKPEVHMYCIMKIGTMNYAIIDNHNTDNDEPSKEETVRMMMDAAKSLMPEEPVKKANP